MIVIDHLASIVTIVGFPLVLFGLVDLYRERQLSMWRLRKWVGVIFLLAGFAAWGGDVADRLGYIDLRTWSAFPNRDRIIWNFEPAARGGAFFLGMFKTVNHEIRIVGFQAHGKNNAKEPVHQFSGWIRSDITNASKPIYILGQDEDESKIAACIPRIPTTFDDTYGIPALADFDVVGYDRASFAATDGISTETFLSSVAPFTVHIEYDSEKIERQFSVEEVKGQIDLFAKISSLESIPRVIRKNDAPKPKPAPLQLLLKSTPVPTLPLLGPDYPNSVTGTTTPKN